MLVVTIAIPKHWNTVRKQYHATNIQAHHQVSNYRAPRVHKLRRLKARDRVGLEIDGNEVRLSKVTPLDLAFSQALEGTLAEWSSTQDDRAFKDL